MHVHFSVNISGWITVGLTQLLRAGPVEQINRVSKGLTEHKTLKKDFTFQGRKKFHTHTSLVVKTEKCMSMSCCGTGLKVSRDNIQIRQTHTHTHTHTYIGNSYLCYTMSVTHRTTRTQDISTCHPFRAGANCSTQGNLLLLLNSSILLQHDECSPAVPLCKCKILPQVHVEI